MPRRKIAECPICGVIKDKNNSYVRKNGYFSHLCKDCLKKAQAAKRFKNLPDEKKQKLVEKYKSALEVLSE